MSDKMREALAAMREWHRVYHGEDPCNLCGQADAALAAPDPEPRSLECRADVSSYYGGGFHIIDKATGKEIARTFKEAPPGSERLILAALAASPEPEWDPLRVHPVSHVNVDGLAASPPSPSPRVEPTLTVPALGCRECEAEHAVAGNLRIPECHHGHAHRDHQTTPASLLAPSPAPEAAEPMWCECPEGPHPRAQKCCPTCKGLPKDVHKRAPAPSSPAPEGGKP